MPKKQKELTLEEILKSTNKLSQRDFRKVVTAYLRETGNQKDKRYNKVVLMDLESHLKELKVNTTCPHCGSKIIVANGKRDNGIQRLKCCDCGKTFTYFTGTILEKTKFHWDLWVELIHQMLTHNSVREIRQNLIGENLCIDITPQTIDHWRYKILNACEQIEQPKLSGTVQIDETHYHEAQQGVHEEDMVQVFPEVERHSRHSYRPAKYGPMGSEFATIITAVDDSQHTNMKVSGLGKFNIDRFTELFGSNLMDINWLCSDANNVYSVFASRYSISHYVRKSDYLDLIKDKELDDVIKLYNDGKLDYIEGRQKYTYNELENIKYKNGLNLGRVNALHQRIRSIFNYQYFGISTKHLNGWVCWLCLLENFKADNGHIPTSRNDAEKILIQILKSKSNVLVKDLYNQKLDLPKPSDKELLRLKANTDKARAIAGRPRFVFTEEDLIADTSIRDMLYKMPLNYLKELCKHYKLKGYTSYLKKGYRLKYIQLLEKEKDIKEQMLKITAQNGKTIYTSEEDIKHQQPSKYSNY